MIRKSTMLNSTPSSSHPTHQITRIKASCIPRCINGITSLNQQDITSYIVLLHKVKIHTTVMKTQQSITQVLAVRAHRSDQWEMTQQIGGDVFCLYTARRDLSYLCDPLVTLLYWVGGMHLKELLCGNKSLDWQLSVITFFLLELRISYQSVSGH